MSNKKSLAYLEIPQKPTELHIYKNIITDQYYIEDENDKNIQLPGVIAQEFAKILNKLAPQEK